jgi:putative spermidine/putrescine transport system ATP-binding protein
MYSLTTECMRDCITSTETVLREAEMTEFRNNRPTVTSESAPSGVDRAPRFGLADPAERPNDIAPQISLRGLRKTFGTVTAVDGIDLDVQDGEFFAMLGPSGSGKTTVLRMIAGFETPTSGSVFLDGTDATGLPSYRRDVNTVFQDYALFPHMTVAKNIEYGLLVDKVPKSKRVQRVGDVLEMVRLHGFGDRRPTQLSGGQRQRVALARALVKRPKVLLLDEPLGALDLKLREQMQLELKAIQRDVGITFVFVTHDQDEALTLCDRLAVFNNGRIEQLGAAQDVYEFPATAFVAGFVGSSNFIRPQVAREVFGMSGSFAVRPEKVAILPRGGPVSAGAAHIDGVVRDVVYAGAVTRIVVDGPAGLTLSSMVLNTASELDTRIRRGTEVTLSWPAAALRRISD